MADSDHSERDRQWAEGIRAGDRTAFQALFHEYHAALCAFAQQYVQSSTVAKDIVQDVFLQVWEGRSRFDPAGTVRAYLYSAVRNRTINHYEHQQVEEKHAETVARPPDDGPYTAPLNQLSYEELEEHLQKAIREMPQRRRQVFVLSRVHRLTYKEIAETLDVTSNTVHTHIKRAMAFLRERFSAYLPEQGS